MKNRSLTNLYFLSLTVGIGSMILFLIVSVGWVAPATNTFDDTIRRVVTLSLQIIFGIFAVVGILIERFHGKSANAYERYVTVDTSTGMIVPNDSSREVQIMDEIKSKDSRYKLVNIPDTVSRCIWLDENEHYSRINLELSIDDVQKYIDNSNKEEREQKKMVELLDKLIDDTVNKGLDNFEDNLKEGLKGTGLGVRTCELVGIGPYVACK